MNRCAMFRLLTLLGIAMFLTLLIGGEDRGQQRFGLRDAPPPSEPVAKAEPAPVVVEPSASAVIAARYEAPVVPAPPELVAPALGPVVEAATAPPAAEPLPEAVALPVRYVSAAAINVRLGPSTNDSVIGRLTRGEAVSVVGEAAEGWLQVRIEGDGIEGYVAARLLSETAP